MEKKTIAKEQRPPKRPHLRMNLVLHECVRASHRQLCSPHPSSQAPEAPAVFSRHRLDRAALGAGGNGSMGSDSLRSPGSTTP